MIVQFAGKTFEAFLASDLTRDGMCLELRSEDMEMVAEVFYSDVTGQMSVTTMAPEVPLEAIEWLIAQAKVRLPPTRE